MTALVNDCAGHPTLCKCRDCNEARTLPDDVIVADPPLSGLARNCVSEHEFSSRPLVHYRLLDDWSDD